MNLKMRLKDEWKLGLSEGLNPENLISRGPTLL